MNTQMKRLLQEQISQLEDTLKEDFGVSTERLEELGSESVNSNDYLQKLEEELDALVKAD